MKKKFLTIPLLFTAFVLPDHEFWLQPEKFIYEPGEPVTIRFNLGENFEGENWNGDTSGIKSLTFYFHDIQDDLTAAMGTEKGDSIQLTEMDEGTAMVTFNSRNSLIQMDPVTFEAFLRENQLNEVIEYREKHKETTSEGREYYQRSVKTVFQVGDEHTQTFNQPTGLPLDIVLQQNPYSLKDSQSLTLKIFFQQEPLKNSLVRIWHGEHGTTTKEEMQTNDNGEISFIIKTSGKWMVSCIKMVRLNNASAADPEVPAWQSYLGSCTWGYE